MIRWGGPEDHFKDYKPFWEGGLQTVRVDICDILEEMGFELPPEGSREQHDVQEQLTALTPQFEVVSKLFIGRICNRTAKANLKAAHKTIIQDAVEHGLLRLRRKP